MSDVARAHFDGVMETVRRGEKVKRDWTLYPFSGEPVNCLMTISGIVLEDGRLACLHEAEVINAQLISPSLLRGIEVVRHTGSKIALHRKTALPLCAIRLPRARSAPRTRPRMRMTLRNIWAARRRPSAHSALLRAAKSIGPRHCCRRARDRIGIMSTPAVFRIP
ncbi:MAG: hypothetical protein ACR2FI_02260 [Burkholderiales bacterium]|nr:hypothetical protein [Burkholderiales bacterium]MDQ3196863.1 hypothetical protein [Pseudomonadota bacterium]